MAFVRVTDPELAAELYSNGLLYEEDLRESTPIVVAHWPEGRSWSRRLQYPNWRFYVQLEE